MIRIAHKPWESAGRFSPTRRLRGRPWERKNAAPLAAISGKEMAAVQRFLSGQNDEIKYQASCVYTLSLSL